MKRETDMWRVKVMKYSDSCIKRGRHFLISSESEQDLTL